MTIKLTEFDKVIAIGLLVFLKRPEFFGEKLESQGHFSRKIPTKQRSWSDNMVKKLIFGAVRLDSLDSAIESPPQVAVPNLLSVRLVSIFARYI